MITTEKGEEQVQPRSSSRISTRNKGLPGVIACSKLGCLVIMSDWKKMKPLQRTWCLYEIWTASKVCEKEIQVLYSENGTGMVSMIELLKKHMFESKINNIDLYQAKTGRDSDQQFIMECIRKGKGSVEEVNETVKKVMMTAAFELMNNIMMTNPKYFASPSMWLYWSFVKSLLSKYNDQMHLLQEDNILVAIYKQNQESRQKNTRADPKMQQALFSAVRSIQEKMIKYVPHSRVLQERDDFRRQFHYKSTK